MIQKAGKKGSAQAPSRSGPPSPDEVRAHLAKVCGGHEFQQSARMKGFLGFVVEEALAGRADQLKAYTIGLKVYQRDASFDPNTDPIVRVDARRLRRKLLAYYADEGAADTIRIEMPKGSYAPRFRVVSNNKAAAPATILDATIEVPTVAVLPFDNLSDDSAQEFFCDGMTEEIITELARYADVAVVGRHSSFKYKGTPVDVRDVAVDLGADFIVEGSVRRGSSNIRVTVQLLDGSTGHHLWAENFTRDLTAQDVIDIQDEITHAVAATIIEPYGVIPQKMTEASRTRASESLSAYEWVLRFYAYWSEPFPERYTELRDNLPRAIELDPSNASLHASYSLLCTDAVRFVRDESKTSAEWLGTAVALGKRAVELDQHAANALQALATAHFHSGELAAFRDASSRAVHFNPSHANLLADMAAPWGCLGEWDEAIPMARRAIELSPHHPNWYHTIPAIYAAIEGDRETALYEADAQITPGLYLTDLTAAAIHGTLGDQEKAKSAADRLLEVRPNYVAEFDEDARLWNMNDAIVALYRDGLAAVGLRIN